MPEFTPSLILPHQIGQARAAEKLSLGDPFTALLRHASLLQVLEAIGPEAAIVSVRVADKLEAQVSAVPLPSVDCGQRGGLIRAKTHAFLDNAGFSTRCQDAMPQTRVAMIDVAINCPVPIPGNAFTKSC